MNHSLIRASHLRTALATLFFTGFVSMNALPLAATDMLLSLDPAATKVSFHLGATGHDVEGVLHLRTGEVRFDPDTGTATGSIVLDARRADTGSKKRDKTMHKKVLLSATHPSITFKAQRFEGTLNVDSPNDVTLHGVVALAGVEHPLTLSATVSIDGENVEAQLAINVPYVEWGLHNPSIVFLRVAKEVRVDIAAVGTLVSATAATAVGVR